MGNTPAISRKSYVHPIVIAQYIDHGLTIAPYVGRMSSRSRRWSPQEAALAAFLRDHFPDRRRRSREQAAA